MYRALVVSSKVLAALVGALRAAAYHGANVAATADNKAFTVKVNSINTRLQAAVWDAAEAKNRLDAERAKHAADMMRTKLVHYRVI